MNPAPSTSTRSKKPPPFAASIRCEHALAAEAEALVARIASSQLDIRTLVDSRAALFRLALTRGVRSIAAELDAAGVPAAGKRTRKSAGGAPSPAPSPEAGGDHADRR